MRNALKVPPICADAVGMTKQANTPDVADIALADVERIISALVPDAAVRESILCAVEMYGDARSDAALSA